MPVGAHALAIRAFFMIFTSLIWKPKWHANSDVSSFDPRDHAVYLSVLDTRMTVSLFYINIQSLGLMPTYLHEEEEQVCYARDGHMRL